MLNQIDLSRTDLNLLVLFEAVMRERHVGRAAEGLNLTASAVSHGLKRLRAMLGEPAFTAAWAEGRAMHLGQAVATALVVGCSCLAALGVCVALGEVALALAFVQTALWGFIAVVYLTVAHRMIPFFTSSAVPMHDAWRPNWVLALLLATAAFEA